MFHIFFIYFLFFLKINLFIRTKLGVDTHIIYFTVNVMFILGMFVVVRCRYDVL